MYKSFDSLEQLFAYMEEEKEWTGVNAVQHHRYPMRFVLFDNFADFNQFIVERPTGIYKHSIDTILDKEYPDQFLSYTELSKEICAFTKKKPINDFIIYPFSEMARFYDNEVNTEFDALIRTISGQQAPEDAQNEHSRIYIPIVGMQGKMGKFIEDNSTFVWEYKSKHDNNRYNLIITNGTTFGVEGLNECFTVVTNLNEWLKLWEKGEAVKRTIICSSPNIYANAHHAQPDNAFTYLECENAFTFLTNGLGLDFGITQEPKKDEIAFWEKLAKEIDITNFNFDEFIKERLNTFTIQNGVDFVKSWLDCESDFDRWLLTLYFRKIADPESYIYSVIVQNTFQSKSDFFSNIATSIFDVINKDNYISERRQVMKIAAERDIKISELAENKLKAKLSAIAFSPVQGSFHQAVKLLTPLTDSELQLCIEWVANGNINTESIKEIYPGLFHYLEPLAINSLDKWIDDYLNAYRFSKIANRINSTVDEILQKQNANTATFYSWFNSFKTVKTILYDRKDIDVFYWIDGLGVDWIPFIKSIIARYSKEHVYLNEVYVATAYLPTITSVNKAKLQSLLPDNTMLPKIGDLDSFAHSLKNYPQYIIDEMKIVENAICKVLDNFNGKKIAFISDHGITYLSQLTTGLKLGGINSCHEGRFASYTNKIVENSKYIKLDDCKTICSLTHQSLTDKVDKGHGAHGGCTPEEVLVPIIIVSSQKNANNYSVKIENDEIDGTMPILRFIIKGLSSIDAPFLTYNGVIYNLSNKGKDIYESERLNLVDTATNVKICINSDEYKFDIKVSTGATEDDLFSSF